MASMSTSMTARIPSDDLDASLARLDARVKDVNGADNHGNAEGPFGVIDFRASETFPPRETISEQVDPERPDPSFGEVLDDSPVTEGLLSNPNDFLGWADLLALDFDNDVFFSEAPFPSESQKLNSVIANAGSSRPIGDFEYLQVPNDGLVDPTTPSPPGSIDLTSPTIQNLLKYFRDQVIPKFSAIPEGHKSPWKILNTTAAVQTLAEMTYLGGVGVKHASLANLYAVLAISAHVLGRAPEDSFHTADYWQQLSTQASNQAKAHLQISLQQETQGIGKCKYKDQLMMIIAMAAYAILTARQAEARCYMIDAERLLRIRGLAKRNISRKARMLHHVYTWLRIVGESTYVLHDYQTLETLVEKALPQDSRSSKESRSSFGVSRSGHNARLDDFLRLDADQAEDDTDLEEHKDRETGLLDIHLEDTREDSESLYLQIYGVSETWLTLVSQTTRLANIIDTIRFSGVTKSVNIMQSLERRKERLENMVCSFAAKSPRPLKFLESDEQSQRNQIEQSPIGCMIRALNASLVIFFYRRVRNVNPWILQVHVDAVIESLQDFDAALAARNLTGPGTVWPAFIAGCEALTEARRERLKHWMEKGFAISGFAAFKVAQETMMDVWSKRDMAGNKTSPGTSSGKDYRTSVTWMDVLRERSLWLMLG
ncbi:hypothetical protein LTR84_009562 [Exophiala bonariae]|uniref:Transcription factor domain-containing protein n=1 Tax=Exophiala bonariae TaxID=1690606 RepID=A0AAV9NJM4_9EURO|nr:hypothetical protein LTR84_009562 [Exophiala bonariae]